MLLLDRHREEQELKDRRVGRICATLANAFFKREGGQPFSEDDFIPKPPKPPQTPEQQVEILKMLGAAAQARYDQPTKISSTGKE